MRNYAPRDQTLGFAEFSEWVAYDPDNGTFVWKKARSRRYKAGMAAGMPKSVRKTTGESSTYVYIGLMRQQIPAARVAWLLHYGEWPKTNLVFKDGNTLNLRIDNLEEAEFKAIVEVKEGKKRYKMPREQARRFGLKRYYGMTWETYNVMLEAQGGVCAICKGTETYQPRTYNGPKALSVDHDHGTGQIRGLLCSNCNYLVGHCKEDEKILLEAINYLRKHKGTAPTTPALTLVSTEDSK